MAHGDQVDTFQIRLDSDSLSFLSGTDFPTVVNLGSLNSHSTFEFFGHDASHPLEGLELVGSITEFEVQRDVVPEPGSAVLLSSGLLSLSAVVLDRRRQRGRGTSLIA